MGATDATLDPEATALLLRCRAPATKDELWLYCKHNLRITCEICKGAKGYYGPEGWAPCEWCGGEGVQGFHLARSSVCEGHTCLLDAVWEIYSGMVRQAIWIANRGGGKTRGDAILEHLLVRFKRYSVTHMGAIDQQAMKARACVRQQTEGDGLPFAYDPATKEPTVPTAGMLPELDQDDATRASWSNGGYIEFVPGTTAQASGPHNEMSVLDEVDEVKDPVVQEKFAKTAFGPRSIFLQTSTHTYATGVMSSILKNQPHVPKRIWCMFEAMQRCAYDCDAVPLPDGSHGRCPLYDEEVTDDAGQVTRESLCGGVKARRSDGHIPVDAAIITWMSSAPATRRIELLCEKPRMGAGAGRAYWAYAPMNDLAFDPEVRPEVPLEWTQDFNPGVGLDMCSLVIQQAPPEYPGEWWVIDEILLNTSSTPAVIVEFQRRYGPNGLRWGRPGMFPGGLWIAGDTTGHSRQSTGETDYEMLVRSLRSWPGFKLLTQLGTANPPIIDRGNVVNQAFWDGVTGFRALRIAPRCVFLRDELSRLPTIPGTREKDKSAKIQRAGLSHLSDTLDYWVWLRRAQILTSGRVPAAQILATAGQRASAPPREGKPGRASGSFFASVLGGQTGKRRSSEGR